MGDGMGNENRFLFRSSLAKRFRCIVAPHPPPMQRNATKCNEMQRIEGDNRPGDSPVRLAQCMREIKAEIPIDFRCPFFTQPRKTGPEKGTQLISALKKFGNELRPLFRPFPL
jgi:hypothetical protein